MRTVHKLCEFLKQHDRHVENRILPKKRQIEFDENERRCSECPGSEMSEYGPLRRGCYAEAVEFLNIVKYGNPWGRKYRNSRRDWPRMSIEQLRKERVRITKRKRK